MKAHFPATEGTEIVVFAWDTRYGPCYDCGAPAAYEEVRGADLGLRYCGVCAAQHAVVDGEDLRWLFEEPPDLPERERRSPAAW